MSGLPAGRVEDASDASQDGLSEETRHRECKEVNEGLWLEPSQALLRRKIIHGRTDNHRNVMNKLFVKEKWVQTERYGIAW